MMGVRWELVHELRCVAGHLLLGGECRRVWRSISPSVVACTAEMIAIALSPALAAATLLLATRHRTVPNTQQQ